MSAATLAFDANQPPPFEGRNLYAADSALRAAVDAFDGAWAHERLHAWGAVLGSASTWALATRANRFIPELRTYDRFGNRIDEVVFDPAWDALMALAMREGEHCAPWVEARPGAQVARAAAYVMHAEVENGTQCPLTMTFAAVPLLRKHAGAHPAIAATWLPRILSREHDPRAIGVGAKRSALIGMGMTERQGGSDVRANATRAVPCGDGTFRLQGHKWFFSAPMCDAHLVLAQTQAGLSCFLLPRVLEDGTRNAVRILRLKDKLGNRSNASSEVEFDDAQALLLGDEGRGVPVIIDMIQHTRLDCVIGSAGLLRSATLQAFHHAAHRRAFGRTLAQQPLMQNVLADLGLEADCALLQAIMLARAFDEDASAETRAMARVATPALKFWICKRAVAAVGEALEVFGGNGYVEEGPMPRLHRESPLNSIWEGSANVIALDVLRAARREPDSIAALQAALAHARGGDRRLDRFAEALVLRLSRGPEEAEARRVAGDIALALGAGLMVRHRPGIVADAYCASRLEPGFAGTYGMLGAGIDVGALLAALRGAGDQPA